MQQPLVAGVLVQQEIKEEPGLFINQKFSKMKQLLSDFISLIFGQPEKGEAPQAGASLQLVFSYSRSKREAWANNLGFLARSQIR